MPRNIFMNPPDEEPEDSEPPVSADLVEFEQDILDAVNRRIRGNRATIIEGESATEKQIQANRDRLQRRVSEENTEGTEGDRP